MQDELNWLLYARTFYFTTEYDKVGLHYPFHRPQLSTPIYDSQWCLFAEQRGSYTQVYIGRLLWEADIIIYMDM